MINSKKLFTKILNHFDDLLTVETYTQTKTVAGNGYTSLDDTLTKPGYYPLGVVGFDVGGEGSAAAQIVKARLSNVQAGSAGIVVGLKNDSTTSRTFTISAQVLWRKIGGGTA